MRGVVLDRGSTAAFGLWVTVVSVVTTATLADPPGLEPPPPPPPSDPAPAAPEPANDPAPPRPPTDPRPPATDPQKGPGEIPPAPAEPGGGTPDQPEEPTNPSDPRKPPADPSPPPAEPAREAEANPSETGGRSADQPPERPEEPASSKPRGAPPTPLEIPDSGPVTPRPSDSEVSTDVTGEATIGPAGDPDVFRPAWIETGIAECVDLRDEPLSFRWPNITGLEELKARLDRHGFRRVIRARVIDDCESLSLDLCGPHPLPGARSSVIAVVSEDSMDDVDLEVIGESLRGRPGDYHAKDVRKDLAGAVRIPEEADRSRLRLRAWHSTPGEATRRWLVMEIVEAEPAETDWTLARPTPRPRPTARPGWRPESIAYIPIRGDVGIVDPSNGRPFVTAADFKLAIDQSRQQGAGTLLLHINTPGGRVDTTKEIQRLLLIEHARGARILAFIEGDGGISAGGLIALGCEHWYITPGAQVGAAVGWHADESGNPEWEFDHVDDPNVLQKFLAISTARGRECCEIYGRDPSLAVAMQSLEPELWWDPEAGFSSRRHTTHARQLDSEDTVLSLTATSVEQTGLGTRVLDFDALLEALGQSRDVMIDLSESMRTTEREFRRLIAKRDQVGLTADEEMRVAELFLRP